MGLLKFLKQVSHLIPRFRLSRRSQVLTPLVLSYLVGFIFTLFEFDEEIAKLRHPFYKGHTFASGRHWDGWVTDANFVYGIMEIASRGLIFVSADLAIKYRFKLRIFWVCGGIEIIDMYDYWLFRNDEWFNTGIEFNYIKIVVILLYACIEYITSPQRLK